MGLHQGWEGVRRSASSAPGPPIQAAVEDDHPSHREASGAAPAKGGWSQRSGSPSQLAGTGRQLSTRISCRHSPLSQGWPIFTRLVRGHDDSSVTAEARPIPAPWQAGATISGVDATTLLWGCCQGSCAGWPVGFQATEMKRVLRPPKRRLPPEPYPDQGRTIAGPAQHRVRERLLVPARRGTASMPDGVATAGAEREHSDRHLPIAAGSGNDSGNGRPGWFS